jgi:hypothetical protein
MTGLLFVVVGSALTLVPAGARLVGVVYNAWVLPVEIVR